MKREPPKLLPPEGQPNRAALVAALAELVLIALQSPPVPQQQTQEDRDASSTVPARVNPGPGDERRVA